jgi:hypothetical protein
MALIWSEFWPKEEKRCTFKDIEERQVFVTEGLAYLKLSFNKALSLENHTIEHVADDFPVKGTYYFISSSKESQC